MSELRENNVHRRWMLCYHNGTQGYWIHIGDVKSVMLQWAFTCTSNAPARRPITHLLAASITAYDNFDNLLGEKLNIGETYGANCKLLGLHTYLGVGWIRRQQDVVARYDDVAETLIELGTVDGQVVVLEPCATFGQRQTDVLILVFW